MNLSPEQIQALDHGDAVPGIIDGWECVMVIREVYDRVRQVIELDPRETYPAVIRAWDAYGSPDDGILYQGTEKVSATVFATTGASWL